MFLNKVEFGKEAADPIYTGWITDEDKIRRIAASDGKSVHSVKRDLIAGMLGELAGYHVLKSYSIKCDPPNFGIITRDEEAWDKDFSISSPINVRRYNGETTQVFAATSKAQLFSQTKKYHKSKILPSWTFQLKTIDRYGDPILCNSSSSRIILASWVNNLNKDGNIVTISNPEAAYKNGFIWVVKVAAFLWSDIHGHLLEPVLSHLRKRKKVLYYEGCSVKACSIL